MVDKDEYILVVQNKFQSRVPVYFYYNWDILNWVPKIAFYVEPDHEGLYQERSPYKYQVKVGTWNDVHSLQEHTVVIIDSKGHIKEEPLSDKKYREIRQSVVLYAKKKIGDAEEEIDCFKALGMERTITKNDSEERAFQQELKRNYRQRMRQYHPDQNPDSTGANERITKEIILAYDILSDKYKRARYINVMDSKNWKRFLKSIYWPEPTSPEEEETRKKDLMKKLAILFCKAALVSGIVVSGSLTMGIGGAVPIGAAAAGGAVLGVADGIHSRFIMKPLKDT